ncbi:MAG: NUDIX hydrolase [Gammaproteobacteria bacterium]|nr:NUDIX hydrolase [Gammaproteobacteria bacterium]MCY4164590.1 NUDIX hydrolase [Gammaproteobacteria bacterium]
MPAHKFCGQCGAPLKSCMPAGEDREREVCPVCHFVHYRNPIPVVGCVAEHEGRILLCRRAIEPRLGYWTVPAGFMELNETLEEGAMRETREEACAEVRLGELFSIVNLPKAGQVHFFFRAALLDGKFGAGPESLETALFGPGEIPFEDIAFRSGVIALRRYLDSEGSGLSLDTVPPRSPD